MDHRNTLPATQFDGLFPLFSFRRPALVARATGTTADLLGVAPLDGTRWRAAWVARDGTAYAMRDSGTVRKRLP